MIASARRHVSEESYFDWLEAIKPYEYLQAVLGDKPSRFGEEFGIA